MERESLTEPEAATVTPLDQVLWGRADRRDGTGAVRTRMARAVVPDAAGCGAGGAGAPPGRCSGAGRALAGGRPGIVATRACRGVGTQRAPRGGQPAARPRPGTWCGTCRLDR